MVAAIVLSTNLRYGRLSLGCVGFWHFVGNPHFAHVKDNNGVTVSHKFLAESDLSSLEAAHEYYSGNLGRFFSAR